jgi:hypothetical protein
MLSSVLNASCGPVYSGRIYKLPHESSIRVSYGEDGFETRWVMLPHASGMRVSCNEGFVSSKDQLLVEW